MVARMRELSAQYPRYGYRRIRIFLGPLGIPNTLADTLRDTKSLDEFYRHESWTIFKYQEVDLP